MITIEEATYMMKLGPTSPGEILQEEFLGPMHEHHIAVYAGKKNDSVVKADRPDRLLNNSLLTPGFAAAIINAKYVNAVPINRISEEFKRNGVNVSRQVMANWMIRMGERYLSLIYDEMHECFPLRGFHPLRQDFPGPFR